MMVAEQKHGANGVSQARRDTPLQGGLRISAPKKGKTFKPLDVEGFDLSRGLDKARGERSR